MDDLPIRTNRIDFDDQPIAKTNNINLDEYPPDFDPSKIQVKAEPLPISKRLNSKVLKIKKEALEELLKFVINQDHKLFRQHEQIVITLIADSNVQCQVLATKILFQFIEKEGSLDASTDQIKLIMKNVIEKLLIIEKEEVHNLGLEVLFWFMDHKLQDMLMNQLNLYLTNKNPKIVGVTFKVIQALVNNYGPKKLGSLQLFCKNLKLLAEPVKPTAKPQMIEFFKELYKWMGENIFSSFTLQAQCKDEVLKWSKTYEMQPMQIKRGLKKGEQGKKVNPNQDEQENSAPVDVLPTYNSQWVDMVLAIQKWQQKKQHLQEFIKKTNVGTIVPRQTTHFITLLKRLFQDNNINLLQCGFKMVKNLCKGLKRSFVICCKSVLSYVYIKLKDNKAMIVDETLATLKAMTFSISIEDFQKEIAEALKDKSPQMRLNTLKLLKELSAKKEPKTTRILKSLLFTLISLTNDSSSEVRDIALAVLCKIKEHHGMIFFEDKLESLPAKKVNQIRSTPTIGNQEEDNKMQIEQNSYNYQKSNNSSISQTSIKTNLAGNKENKIQIQTQNQKKKPTSIQSEPHMGMGKSLAKNPQIEKKPSYSMDNKQKKPYAESSMPLPLIREESHQSFTNTRSQEQELLQIRNQEWPIVPTPVHVHRLINLFNKLGEPFVSLATPFKLTNYHMEILQNSQHIFMTQNADLLLKWALWRIQIENPVIIEKITSVVIHIIYLLRTNMSDSHTLLIMSILSNLLESDLTKTDMLYCINLSIFDISEFLREKVFNFWITTLSESSHNQDFCEKILKLLQNTFTNLSLNCNEVVAMARVEPILKSKSFLQFLTTKVSRQFLKVSGFKLQDQSKPQCQWLLRQSETDFCTDIRVDQRIYFLDIFKKMSHQASQQIINIEKNCLPEQLINTHIKIMDTMLLPFLDQSLQSINLHNYFSKLMHTLQNIDEAHVTPYLRNLLRLLMFFLVDVNASKLQDKDKLIKSANKLLLIVLEKIPADHLIEVLTMLLRYSENKNFTKRLTQVLIKCINKATSSESFVNKAQKNVKLLFNFFISYIEDFKIPDNDPNFKSILNIFETMMNRCKELCIEIVIEKMKYFNGEFISAELMKLFTKFLNKPEQSTQNSTTNPDVIVTQKNMNEQPDNRVMENNSFMSNLPQNYSNQAFGIRQGPTILRREDPFRGQIKPVVNNSTDILTNDGAARIAQDRRKLQTYTGLCQSFAELTQMQTQMNAASLSNNNNAQSTINHPNRGDTEI